MHVPLVHPPRHAQADFGTAQAVIGGVVRKASPNTNTMPASVALRFFGTPRRCTFTPALTGMAWRYAHIDWAWSKYALLGVRLRQRL